MASIFPDAWSPTTNDDTGTGSITLGSVMVANVAGSITSYRMWRPSTAATLTWTLAVHGPSGVLTSQTYAHTTGTTGWVEIPLSTPLALAAGDKFLVARYTPDARYGSVAGFFNAAVTSADSSLTAPATGTVTTAYFDNIAGNGRYLYNAGTATTRPSNTINGGGYGIDVVFTPAATTPVVNAGVDVTGHIRNTAFTRTATETANGTISARAWTVVSGPAQVGATLATAAALSWTPATAGTYVLRYSATNENGTGTDDMSITVVAAQELTPLSVVTSAGVSVTGAADIIAALDSNDTTSYASVDAGETLEVLLDPGAIPATRTGQVIDIALSGAGTATIALYEGATLRFSTTQVLTGGVTTYALALTEAQANTFTAYTDIRLRITVA